MPSPFPGMDPYIESSGRWGDFHGSMVAAIRNDLNERLPEGFAADIDLYIGPDESEIRRQRKRFEPDIYVTEEGRHSKVRAASATITPPRIILLASVKRKRHKYVRIIDLESNRVVTAIELLSPSNKRAGDDREAYLAKRNKCLESKVSLVEIDLLRGGRRLPLSDPPPETKDYYVMVCRAWEYPRAAFWSFTIRDPLPEVPIPLTKNVPDVMFPLRPSMDQAYRGGRYSTRLKYEEPLRPRLRKQDADWVRQLLAAWSSTRSS